MTRARYSQVSLDSTSQVTGDTHDLGDVLRGLWLFSDVGWFE